MSKTALSRAALIIMCLGIIPLSASGRNADYASKSRKLAGDAAAEVCWSECWPVHNVGKIVLKVGWASTFGITTPLLLADCFTREVVPHGGAEYPKRSKVSYLHIGELCVGGVLRRDTLVSTGMMEMYPPDREACVEFRSILDPSAPEFEGAISEQDYIGTEIDTVTSGVQPDYFFGHPHKPLFIELTTRSYSWSYGYAEDFVLFDLSIKNIGKKRINDTYFGIEIYPDVGFKGGTRITNTDDLGGFVKTVPSPYGCGFVDTLNIMWWADNDGDPVDGVFTDRKVVSPEGNIIRSCPDVTGIHIIHPPVVAGRKEWGKATLSYNWQYASYGWVNDFGPRRRQNYRDFGTGGLGWPAGDRNLYYVMSSGEVDYDQAFTATISQFDPVWMYPLPDIADDIADGIGSVKHLLSFGPFDLDPGATLPIVFTYVAGEDFHTAPDNIDNLPDDPRR